MISGATELLLADRSLPEKTKLRILRIARAARQSTDITTALLHLVRAEQGVNQDSDAQDVCKIVDKLIHLHEPLLDNKPLELKVVSEDKVSVIAPESVIAVAVGNLISNAVRYTAAGGRVSVWCGERGGRAIVTVTDTGIGIPKSEHERIFNRFHRVDTARSRATGGTGLGLAIVRHVVDRHGGWVLVD